MPWNIPEIKVCCGCVKDLKTAAAIIAVLGIVTSPAVSWAVVRHSYVIRVSCYVTTSATRPDIVDINLNNILSFGFGANAGLGASCLGSTSNATKSSLRTDAGSTTASSKFVQAVKYIGWTVLFVDLIFLVTSAYFLFRIFHGSDTKASKYFMYAAALSIVMSFIYGMLYVTACISVGGAFPVFEFVFSVVDVLLWHTWIYFILVIRAYAKNQEHANATIDISANKYNMFSSVLNPFYGWFDYINQLLLFLSLKTGSIIIGVLSIFCFWNVAIIYVPPKEAHFKTYRPGRRLLPLREQFHDKPAKITEYFVYASDVILCIFGVVLLVGIFMENPIMVACWVIGAIQFMLTSIFYWFFVLWKAISVNYSYYERRAEGYEDLLVHPYVRFFLALPFHLVFHVWAYFIFVVNSYRMQM